LERLLRLDGPSRVSRVEEGLTRARSYNWERAAADTWRILQIATNG
jgi:hypothetical protein